MRVLLVRHAIAVARDSGEADTDAERPLTARGISRMRRAARGIRALAPEPPVVMTSPFRRAVETADILARVYGKHLRPETLDLLRPGGSPTSVIRWLRSIEDPGTIALVGHEPMCSALLAQLVAGRNPVHFDFRKGAAALVCLNDRRAVGGATLEWLASPRLLRLAGR